MVILLRGIRGFSRLLIIAAAAALSAPALIGSGVVRAETEAERQQAAAQSVFENLLCKEGNGKNGLEPHTDDWYHDWMKIEDSAPYEMKGNGSPGKSARKTLYKVANLNPETRKEICENTTRYANELEAQTDHLKGDLKLTCRVNIDRRIDKDGELGKTLNCGDSAGQAKLVDTKFLAYKKITDYDDEGNYGGPKK
ncbi:hypothetical protein [Nocardia terpenica]|uniref:Uncharacterized protein n=1 Tax=Nocardia terpenica TaxID=455432 RepID=A0A164H4J3_9NOCA|nr:hypothetical protein [Nocardia terpenica]KZM68193.1 hypothetical protein AWN90_09700 [Nocardia terpenica]NQE88936.1 hypothetical protein [Nocardia terpenica]